MNYIKERYKKENKRNIGIEPVVDMKHFVMLLLADMAKKSPILYFDKSKMDIKTACLESDYKRVIEEIMYAENGWGIKFAEFIDITEYYESQIDWEKEFDKTIKKVCEELDKEYRFDIEDEYIEIDFTKEEIENIRSYYDEHILETMDHFSNLMYAPVFRRSFKIETKEMTRNGARWETEMEDSKLRVAYQNNIRVFKPSSDSEPETKKEKSFMKKLEKLILGE